MKKRYFNITVLYDDARYHNVPMITDNNEMYSRKNVRIKVQSAKNYDIGNIAIINHIEFANEKEYDEFLAQ